MLAQKIGLIVQDTSKFFFVLNGIRLTNNKNSVDHIISETNDSYFYKALILSQRNGINEIYDVNSDQKVIYLKANSNKIDSAWI